jgi:tRNA G18 (ribose-2'-O)-methylase SpoU
MRIRRLLAIKGPRAHSRVVRDPVLLRHKTPCVVRRYFSHKVQLIRAVTIPIHRHNAEIIDCIDHGWLHAGIIEVTKE